MERPASFPVPPQAAQPVAGFTAPATEGSLAKAPEAAVIPASGMPSMETLRTTISTALVEAGHDSAGQLLGTGSWSLDGSQLRIEVAGMGKKMIALTVNAAAEKILRQELQRLGGPSRFMVVPGEGSGSASVPVAAPKAGSIQQIAMEHPLVQRAQEIFKAEVRSVVDLRKK